jgi:hypothetical protein
MTAHLQVRALLLAIAASLALAACGGDDDDPAPASTTPATTAPAETQTTAEGPQLAPAFGSMDDLPGILKTRPPWDANAGKLQQRLRAIGLPALSEEGQVLHIHQHLDLFVDGEPVPVAANFGIADDRTFISPLHTHEPRPGDPPDGILHVESPTEQTFTLGQMFAVWGVRLDAKCLGGLCESGEKKLRTWVNGEPFEGDPTRIALEEHQQIVIAYGTEAQVPDPIPATYDWQSSGL